MAYHGTFARHEPGNYGGKLIITTDKGEWKMDNNLPQGTPLPAPGTPVAFEAEKKGNYWKCKSMTPANGAAYQAPVPAASAAHYQAPPPAYQPTPSAVQVDQKDVHIFITGVLQRFYAAQGMPTATGVYDDIMRLKSAYLAAMTGGPRPQAPGESPPTGGPPPGHPANMDDIPWTG
jgi:hypothetical protein